MVTLEVVMDMVDIPFESNGKGGRGYGKVKVSVLVKLP